MGGFVAVVMRWRLGSVPAFNGGGAIEEGFNVSTLEVVESVSYD